MRLFSLSSLVVTAALSFVTMVTTAKADRTMDRIKAKDTLTVGVILSGAPFGYIDQKTHEQKGINIELAQALADSLGVKLATVTVTPPNRVQFLKQGKVDILIANMQYTDERAKILEYVPTPYDNLGGAAIGRKDSGIKDWTDLKGRTVCISQGSNYAKPLITQYGAIVKAMPTQPDSLIALKGGNCDASVHVSATLGLLLQDRADEWKDYAILIPTDIIPSDSVIWLDKGQTDTRDALDKTIKTLHASGKLLEISKANQLIKLNFLQQQHQKYSQEQ